MVVWKFNLMSPMSTGQTFIRDVPVGTRLLSVGMHDDQIVVWGHVPDAAAKHVQQVVALVVNTGMEFRLPEGARFLGTVTSSSGIVWHVWVPEDDA